MVRKLQARAIPSAWDADAASAAAVPATGFHFGFGISISAAGLRTAYPNRVVTEFCGVLCCCPKGVRFARRAGLRARLCIPLCPSGDQALLARS